MDTHEPAASQPGTPAPPGAGQPAPGRPQPLDPPMVPLALAGTGAWAVAGLVLLIAGAPAVWLRTCLAGVLLGLALLALMAVHDRHRARRQSSVDPAGTGSTSVSS